MWAWYLLLVPIFGVIYRAWSKRRRRMQLLVSKLSAQDWATVIDWVPLVAKLPPELQGRLQGKMNLFLSQVRIYGKNGVVVDREVELSLSAQACLLIVNSDVWYNTLHTVLLYPGAFHSKQQRQDGYLVTETKEVRLGESWRHGPVVLSWPHAEQGGVNDEDGHNLILHEFAHQLDALSGDTNGVPILAKGQSHQDWEAAIMRGYEAHVANVGRNRKTVLDSYAATNYVEFLAVSIEVFFEKPEKFHEEYPEVYKQISILLNLDPLAWG
ncbi:zinc-dependent peptidase [Octadecabacter ascidiaceicola]|uniref:Protein MtfA n=1 Tax=Octadecabacter ascidiaceicola TaxID=1655543 RepID=A0A238JP95_9RHOB|nr:M90 family metallopeptidase [Octadecabacter ascidiaceicola]SMX31997.1 Protein MtfA [Octadecabacter ascidiaceicola]